jgi:hypothetical protein
VRAEQHFTVEQMTQGVEEVYRQAIKGTTISPTVGS